MRARIGDLQDALEHERARTELAEQQLTEMAAPAAPAAPDGPTWTPAAQRALAAALAGVEDWRGGVKAALAVIGSDGGWDAICAWHVEPHQGYASCFASWIAYPGQMNEFETATWQRRQPLSASCIGDAFDAPDSRWLLADPESADPRLQALARHRMGGAMILPIRDGARVVAARELLTATTARPNEELITAIEAIALQLGHLWHLFAVAAQPVWRFGRG
jgi:hypothetical protein